MKMDGGVSNANEGQLGVGRRATVGSIQSFKSGSKLRTDRSLAAWVFCVYMVLLCHYRRRRRRRRIKRRRKRRMRRRKIIMIPNPKSLKSPAH